MGPTRNWAQRSAGESLGRAVNEELDLAEPLLPYFGLPRFVRVLEAERPRG